MKTNKGLPFLLAIVMAFCHTQAMAQIQWTPIGTAGFSGGVTANVSIAVDTGNVPYIAYLDAAASGDATVKKFDGTNWVTVGNAGFSNGSPYYTSLAFDSNNTPYVGYSDNSYGGKAVVKKFDGTNWVNVGTATGFSAGQAMYFSLVFDNNDIPYVAYRDYGNGTKATVMKYDGTNWVTVGNAGFSAAGAPYISLAFDGNTPYVAYRDEANSFGATVMKYNGTAWVPVGPVGFSSGSAYYITLAIHNGTPYVGYQDGAFSQKAVVSKYDGANWVHVGTSGFSPGFADNNLLAIDANGTLYVAFKDYINGTKASVMMFDGTNWVNVGNAGFSAGNYYYPSFIVDKNGVPMLGYTDFANNEKTTVMGFTCPAPVLNAAICAAYTDTLTGQNKIVWSGANTPHVDSYKIYREDNGNYVKIATVSGSTYTYTDATANPATQSYKYKLTLTDSCGREMDIDSSAMHKTVLLSFDSYAADDASFSWNKYTGIPNLVYDVKRSFNGGAYTTIASFGIAGSDTTYTDQNLPVGNYKYRIDAAIPNPCTAGGVTYSKITSNAITVLATGLDELVYGGQVSLSPNPADGLITIIAAYDINTVQVFDITGKEMLSQQYKNKREARADISLLPSGVYFVRINDAHTLRFVKR